ncbi:hypothetical protein CMO89_03390 [Candidatus Woesearchaeota archaeon]|nr:hypothetical protein [Candidatus Woesearchaeota archaeon]|tara:strand:+ start:3037 stop:3828 length:792 start_codon:yes stop_codon:yes gene_type:complete
MVRIVKKISKGSRFNQVYLQKNEGIDFKPGKTVIITPLTDILAKELPVFEYNVKLDSLKKEIIKKIFEIIDNSGNYDNIIITGSFLNKGFNFEDIDIIIINPKSINKENLENSIKKDIEIMPHLILIDSESFNRGIKRDPLFRLMINRYVSIKRNIFRKDKEINYKLLDAYLLKNKNFIEGYDFYNIKQRKKLLRDFISIRLFTGNKEVTIKNVKKEIELIFGKDIIEKLFYYGDAEAKRKFIIKLKKEFNKLERRILVNASK